MVTFFEALAAAKARHGIPSNTFTTAPKGTALYKLAMQIMHAGGGSPPSARARGLKQSMPVSKSNKSKPRSLARKGKAGSPPRGGSTRRSLPRRSPAAKGKRSPGATGGNVVGAKGGKRLSAGSHTAALAKLMASLGT